jgi:RNA polymerase sigma-70 factor, ECF subfamily
MYYDNRVNATALLISCREGDPAALDEFVRRCQPLIERLALTILEDGRSPDLLPEVQAVVQTTLLSALSAMNSFRDEAEFNTWLVGLGLKACRKQLRRRAGAAAPAIPVSGQRSSLVAAVQSLDEDQRLPVLLHYSFGFSIQQVAQVLNVSQNAILARLSSARDRLIQ